MYEGNASIAPHNCGGGSLYLGTHSGSLVAVTCNNLKNNELL